MYGNSISKIIACFPVCFGLLLFSAFPSHAQPNAEKSKLIRSVRSGPWSRAITWEGGKIPGKGERVLIRKGHTVHYDVNSDTPIRAVFVAGFLKFAPDKDTRLDVGLLRVQTSEECTEEGFDCHAVFEPSGLPRPALEIGTANKPIESNHRALIRLVYFPGMDKKSLPAMVCCGARMDIHGTPMSRTWVELGKTANKGDRSVDLSEPVQGWRKGDRVIVTAAKRATRSHGVPRNDPKSVSTEMRTIVSIDCKVLTLDAPLQHEHWGDGEYRSEIANLSRNVIIESADPGGVRGHTMYHRHSAGSISYAEFRHLGKEGVLGRYAIHFHLVDTTMRGSYVQGASIWDSHNRWITVHGTQYMVVRDCVGYQSVGHGYFLEDGTEVYNLFDRNLGVQAFAGKPLPNQVIDRDENDGAAFWWANARNTLIRNVACESNLYGFNFSCEAGQRFDPNQRILMPDGKYAKTDIRKLPFYRFEANEAHSNGLSGMLMFITGDGGPDRKHPHIVKDLTIWNTHYAFRPQIPKMLIENLRINGATYGIYRAETDHHVYRNTYLGNLSNRAVGFAGRADGHGRGGIQPGPFSHDGLTIENSRLRFPFVCMNMTGKKPNQEAHFRNITIRDARSPRNMVDIQPAEGGIGGNTNNGVTYYFHDVVNKGSTHKVVGTRFPNLLREGDFKELKGFTGNHVKTMAVKNVKFPNLLDPVDDLAPATIVMSVQRKGDKLVAKGVSHDNGVIRSVLVNGQKATWTKIQSGVVDWQIVLDAPADGRIRASAIDEAGNVEQLAHVVSAKQ